MKKNKAMRTAAGVMVATVLTLGMVSGAFAKYTSGYEFGDGGSGSGSSSAKVAKWDIELKAGTQKAEDLKSYGLFNKIYDEEEATLENGVLTAEEDEDVASSCIAPGTIGTLTSNSSSDEAVSITITNNSEVNARWYLTVTLTYGEDEFTVEDYELPLEFAFATSTDSDLDSLTWSTAAELAAASSGESSAASGFLLMASEATAEKAGQNAVSGYLLWRWQYSVSDDQDVIDTAWGEAIAAKLAGDSTGSSFKLAVTLVVEQVD